MPLSLSAAPAAANGAARRLVYSTRRCLQRVRQVSLAPLPSISPRCKIPTWCCILVFAQQDRIFLSVVRCRYSTVTRSSIRGMADVETQKAPSPALSTGILCFLFFCYWVSWTENRIPHVVFRLSGGNSAMFAIYISIVLKSNVGI